MFLKKQTDPLLNFDQINKNYPQNQFFINSNTQQTEKKPKNSNFNFFTEIKSCNQINQSTNNNQKPLSNKNNESSFIFIEDSQQSEKPLKKSVSKIISSPFSVKQSRKKSKIQQKENNIAIAQLQQINQRLLLEREENQLLSVKNNSLLEQNEILLLEKELFEKKFIGLQSDYQNQVVLQEKEVNTLQQQKNEYEYNNFHLQEQLEQQKEDNFNKDLIIQDLQEKIELLNQKIQSYEDNSKNYQDTIICNSQDEFQEVIQQLQSKLQKMFQDNSEYSKQYMQSQQQNSQKNYKMNDEKMDFDMVDEDNKENINQNQL